MKLPQVKQPERYTGLYIFDFGEQTAIGYTADEIAVLLESQQYTDGKVYRIHRALPDGTMELQGVPRERFETEDGMIFVRSSLDAARADLAELERLVASTPPPCRMKAQLATIAGSPEGYVVALIFPAEFTHNASSWLLDANYRGGDMVEGGVSAAAAYYQASKMVIERRQWWPTSSASRPAEEVLATTHLPLQRRFA